MHKFRCSELPRLARCPGSYAAQFKCPEGETSAAAESGTRIHRALEETAKAAVLSYRAGESFRDHMLACVDANALLYTESEREQFISRWFAGIVGDIADAHGGIVNLEVEAPFEMFFGEGSEGGIYAELTGHVDLILHCTDGTRHVIDYKTGHAAVDTSDVNEQGQGYAVLFFSDSRYRIERAGGVFVHFITAGNDEGERHTFTNYTLDHLAHLLTKIEGICAGSLDVDAPRKTSVDACQYCAAACTTACGESMRALYFFGTGEIDSDADIPGALAKLSDEARAAAVDEARLVYSLADKVKRAARDMIKADPDAIPGYTLSEETKTKTINDTMRARDILEPVFELGERGFLECCKASLSQLKATIGESEQTKAVLEGLPKPTKKATAKLVEGMLDLVIEERARSGSLRRVDKTQEFKSKPKLLDELKFV